MPYDQQQVAQILRSAFGGAASLVNSVGAGESTVTSQHQTALDFWQTALSLTGDDALSSSDAVLAQSEVDRHTAALQPVEIIPSQHAEPV
jgi:hypothetical protein